MNLLNALSESFDQEHRGTAKIISKSTNGYIAEIDSGGNRIILSGGDEYAVNDKVFYDIKKRIIIEKAPNVMYQNISIS